MISNQIKSSTEKEEDRMLRSEIRTEQITCKSQDLDKDLKDT